MSKLTFFAASIVLASTASFADNCDALKSQIESKIKSAGVASFSVLVVEAEAKAPGKVVGTCAKGLKKIMYAQNGAASAAPAAENSGATAAPAKTAPVPAKSGDGILTECKDGSTSVGGTCKK
jgi:hypothetical protein